MIAAVRADVGRQVSDWEVAQSAERGFAPSKEETAVWGEAAIIGAVETAARRELAAGRAPLSEADEDAVIDAVRSWVFGHGRLDALLADDRIENILANGHDNVTLSLVGGERVPGPALADSEEEFEQLIRRWAATEGKTERRFDDAFHTGLAVYSNVVDARFKLRNLTTENLTTLHLAYGTSGELRGVPVRAMFRPRWWMEIELELARSSAARLTSVDSVRR